MLTSMLRYALNTRSDRRDNRHCDDRLVYFHFSLQCMLRATAITASVTHLPGRRERNARRRDVSSRRQR